MTGCVALRKESVDRNSFLRPSRVGKNPSLSARRAWIEIANPGSTELTFPGSLSARRAWIEMIFPLSRQNSQRSSLSARRAWIEIAADWLNAGCLPSLSARRAWIEMSICECWTAPNHVALRKESVDRNMLKIGTLRSTHSRSPQGERG